MDRRNNPRNKFSCFARCRELSAPATDAEKLCVIKDYSHDGIHFMVLSRDHALREKMQLLLRFPYIEQSPVTDREFLVEVMRINCLFLGRYGLGARLLQPMPKTRKAGMILPEIAVPKQPLIELASPNISFYA